MLIACGSHRNTIKEGSAAHKPVHAGEKTVMQQAKKTAGPEYSGEPWVKNISRPFTITQGLQNRHIALWASHGRYYNNKKSQWAWQRPYLFCTTEDLFTQTIVVPYLIPMLENAGANVFTPRERDWQRNEVIVDNDDIPLLPYYTEINITKTWNNTEVKGFAYRKSIDKENPFELGTVRMAKTSARKECEISYQPRIPKKGRYAVYVSYATVKKSVPDAQYIVCHQGKQTVFKVNQQMGGGTWVYLGTFDFDEGCNTGNRVILTNVSSHKGIVTADAVRFGGGMGNIKRGGAASGMARCFEGARYYAQWAGAPDSVYNSKSDTDDYSDDINARSYMTNWLAGGSCFVPSLKGKNVPLELSLGVHSDAGYSKDYTSIIGSLSICTTGFHGGKLNSGLPRTLSKIFAKDLLAGVQRDINHKYGNWNIRELYDRNYSETRCPEIPSAILETLSHQNFPDMRLAQDPNFRFTLARSIYKTMLRFLSEKNGKKYTVAPLAPINPYIEYVSSNEIVIRWDAAKDKLEPTAVPTSYVIYTSAGTGGFDNGTVIKGNACRIALVPGLVYKFKITAVNAGGESFPSETLAAACHEGATKTVMIVNGFHRLSAPAVIENDSLQGFDIYADMGVSHGITAGWSGRQINFDKKHIGIETKDGLGYSGNEMEGMLIAGNNFDYTVTHTEAISAIKKYNVVSCSSKAVEEGRVDLNRYACVDMILGLEKNNKDVCEYYKTFTSAMQEKLRLYMHGGGRLLVSGSYIASDMLSDKEQKFMKSILHTAYNGSEKTRKGNITGMGTSFDIYRMLNESHYAATSPDILHPIAPAFCALTYDNGMAACVAYSGQDFRTIAIGFPFECITSAKKRNVIMRGMMSFLLD